MNSRQRRKLRREIEREAERMAVTRPDTWDRVLLMRASLKHVRFLRPDTKQGGRKESHLFNVLCDYRVTVHGPDADYRRNQEAT